MLGLRPKRSLVEQEIISDLPRQSIRDVVNKFAGQQPDGFIDEDLYRLLPDVPQGQLRTRRNELWRDGLIVKHKRGRNAAGSPCWIWLHVEFTGQPAKAQPKRLTHGQLLTKLKTVELEREIDRARIGALVEAMTPSGDTKAAYMGEFKMSVHHQGYDEDGEPLEGSYEVTIPWDVTKDIMKAIAARASATLQQKD